MTVDQLIGFAEELKRMSPLGGRTRIVLDTPDGFVNVDGFVPGIDNPGSGRGVDLLEEDPDLDEPVGVLQVEDEANGNAG